MYYRILLHHIMYVDVQMQNKCLVNTSQVFLTVCFNSSPQLRDELMANDGNDPVLMGISSLNLRCKVQVLYKVTL